MNRRLLLPLCIVVLASCGDKGSLPPEDVLERAARAGITTDTARFTLEARYDAFTDEESETHAFLSSGGRMTDGGRQMQTTIDLRATHTLEGTPLVNATLNGELIMLNGEGVFLLLDDLSLTGNDPLVNAVSFPTGQWMRMGAGSGKILQAGTPDPRLLALQTQVVRVTQRHDMTNVHGRNTYHYSVEIDPQKLERYLQEAGQTPLTSEDREQWKTMQAAGELWIDAETFVLHRAHWELRQPTTAFSLEVDITEHNEDMTISPPANAVDATQILPSAFPLQP